ncbi:MAG: T9SS type A sorting domain-containing protein, partial [Ignavibacteriaceae bacterium]
LYSTPVELLSFTSSVYDDDVTLNWITATETNNSGFQIERNTLLNPLSRGEAEGSGVWENIGFVNGNGTTTETKTYSFKDENLSTGKYQYRLKQIDFDGTFEYSNIVEGEILPPIKFSLEQNFPNPFNPTTTIKWQTPKEAFQTLKVFDVLGNEIATLVNEVNPAGSHHIDFNASALASGLYFYQLKYEGLTLTKKMLTIK